MPKSSRFLLAAAVSLGLALPALAEPAAGTVVATVGDETITLGHMILMTAQLPQEYQQLPDEVLYDAVLDQLIRQTAVAQTIEGKLSTEAQLAMENERRSFLAGEALSLLAQSAVTDEALKAAYDERFANAAPELEYNASHILLETQEKAAEVRAEIAAGADFAEMAKTHSTGPTGPTGGALGWFSKGMMVKPFEDAVTALEVGQLSEPVQTSFGWHVITLNETREKATPALEEVRGELAGQIQQAAITEALDEITAAAAVTRSEEKIDPAELRNMELLKD
ncbi:peptidylprolyl isomerase [Actibacterium sp. MT2.3-13A]|uniref:peptidylprolyl isomerase n=1 Tax=Actibacterium sp. MT2.3-13A TaxID=2828332 RepID=UPI001BAAA6D0|nr:peptidylprolyl isomerase [Actibacterium sp. MT2.3-13A]